MNEEVYKKIISKKEFSQLPKEDVEKAYSTFENRQISEEEKIRLTREVLHKVFGAFLSKKLLTNKDKEEEWILKKHLSSRERWPFYKQLYQRLLMGLGKKITVLDLGAGVNGFSYTFFKSSGFSVNYIGIEAIGQLNSLVQRYFDKNNFSAKMIHLSLFDLYNLKKIIKDTETPRVVFLFKVIDSLEMLERDFSKKLISSIAPLADRFVISFSTESMIKRKIFLAKRTWILNFLKENFIMVDDFNFEKERYIVFRKK